MLHLGAAGCTGPVWHPFGFVYPGFRFGAQGLGWFWVLGVWVFRVEAGWGLSGFDSECCEGFS